MSFRYMPRVSTSSLICVMGRTNQSTKSGPNLSFSNVPSFHRLFLFPFQNLTLSHQQLDFPSLFYLLFQSSSSSLLSFIPQQPSPFHSYGPALDWMDPEEEGNLFSLSRLIMTYFELKLCPVLFRLLIRHLICADPFPSSSISFLALQQALIPAVFSCLIHSPSHLFVGLSRCYTNEAAAQATCPTEEGIREGKFKEFLLIRKYTFLFFSVWNLFDWRANREKAGIAERMEEQKRSWS